MAPPPKSLRMISPQTLRTSRGGTLPPTVRVQELHSPITRYVANPEAMPDVCAPWPGFGNSCCHPAPGRIFRIRLRVLKGVVPGMNNLRLAVAVDIFQQCVFIADGLDDEMLVPVPRFPFRVHI